MSNKVNEVKIYIIIVSFVIIIVFGSLTISTSVQRYNSVVYNIPTTKSKSKNPTTTSITYTDPIKKYYTTIRDTSNNPTALTKPPNPPNTTETTITNITNNLTTNTLSIPYTTTSSTKPDVDTLSTTSITGSIIFIFKHTITSTNLNILRTPEIIYAGTNNNKLWEITIIDSEINFVYNNIIIRNYPIMTGYYVIVLIIDQDKSPIFGVYSTNLSFPIDNINNSIINTKYSNNTLITFFKPGIFQPAHALPTNYTKFTFMTTNKYIISNVEIYDYAISAQFINNYFSISQAFVNNIIDCNPLIMNTSLISSFPFTNGPDQFQTKQLNNVITLTSDILDSNDDISIACIFNFTSLPTPTSKSQNLYILNNYNFTNLDMNLLTAVGWSVQVITNTLYFVYQNYANVIYIKKPLLPIDVATAKFYTLILTQSGNKIAYSINTSDVFPTNIPLKDVTFNNIDDNTNLNLINLTTDNPSNMITYGSFNYIDLSLGASNPVYNILDNSMNDMVIIQNLCIYTTNCYDSNSNSNSNSILQLS